MQTKPLKFAQGNFGEGYATYALLSDGWFSINGTANEVFDIRWKVSKSAVLQALNSL